MKEEIEEGTKELKGITIDGGNPDNDTIRNNDFLYRKLKTIFHNTCDICFEIPTRESYCNCKINFDGLVENELTRAELMDFINLYEDSVLNSRLYNFYNDFKKSQNRIIEAIINRVFNIIIVNACENTNYYQELLKSSDFSIIENYEFSKIDKDYLDSILILNQLLYLLKYNNNIVKFVKGICGMKLATISVFGYSLYADELDMFHDLIEDIEDNWYLNYLIGFTYCNTNSTNRMDDADLYFNECIKKNPKFAPAYFYRAKVNEFLFNLDYEWIIIDTDSIFRDYEKCIELNPYFDLAYSSLGRAILNYDRFTDKRINSLNAIENYNKAIYLNKNNDVAYFNRSILYLELNEFKNAMLDIENAMKITTTQDYYVIKARINIKLDNLILALKDYDNACFMEPNSYSFWDERSELIENIKKRGLFTENLTYDFNNWREAIGI